MLRVGKSQFATLISMLIVVCRTLMPKQFRASFGTRIGNMPDLSLRICNLHILVLGMADSGARYLVLGGCGMVGRNLTEYLLSSNLASSIRIADKSVPHFAFYNERHLTFFKDERVDFVQADLSNDAHLDNVFNPEKGAFDYVINLAAETKHGLVSAHVIALQTVTLFRSHNDMQRPSI